MYRDGKQSSGDGLRGGQCGGYYLTGTGFLFGVIKKLEGGVVTAHSDVCVLDAPKLASGNEWLKWSVFSDACLSTMK